MIISAILKRHFKHTRSPLFVHKITHRTLTIIWFGARCITTSSGCLSHRKKKSMVKKKIKQYNTSNRRSDVCTLHSGKRVQQDSEMPFSWKKKFCSDLPISRRNCVCTLQMLCQMRFPSIEIVYLIIMQTYQFVAIIIVTRIINQVLCALAHVLQFIHPLCNSAYTLVGCGTQATDNGWT